MERNKVLIVEDDRVQRLFLSHVFEGKAFRVDYAASIAQAKEMVDRFQPDVILLDYQLPDGTALDLMHSKGKEDPLPPIVIITSLASIELAVSLIKEGADQFLVKPVQPAALLALCERLVDRSRLRQKDTVHRLSEDKQAFNPFFGVSPAIRALENRVKRVLLVDSPILIHGETGTGKSALARWIHQHTKRQDYAFVELNCAGLSRELLESELFGHEKGAFTGAVAGKVGMMELANRGTLFLDEIAEMEPTVQAKILKAIEERTFHRLGDTRDRSVVFSLIGATHHNLEQLLPTGRFREDLYYRISTIQLVMPALRDRRADIPMLARLFLARIAAGWDAGSLQLSPGAEDWLVNYDWPGNIRELRNALERAVLARRGPTLEAEDLSTGSMPARTRTAGPTTSFDPHLTLQEVERLHIQRVMEEEGYQVDPAATRLGIPRSTLYVKLKTYGITSSRIQKSITKSRF